MPKPGQYTKSEFLIWDQSMEGTRWRALAFCRGCLLLEGEQDEQPYLPLSEDITVHCSGESSLPEITALYQEPLNSLALIDGIDNVPTVDKEEAEEWLMGTTDCVMPGPSHTIEIRWQKIS